MTSAGALVHCNDPNCDGDDETIRVIDTTNSVGRYASLVLDASGNPVIVYCYSATAT